MEGLDRSIGLYVATKDYVTESWREQDATDDSNQIRAERKLAEFKKAMNESSARVAPLFPWAFAGIIRVWRKST